MKAEVDAGKGAGREISTRELGVLDALRKVRFGSVEVVIHDGQVVQIERKEKVRFAS
jgi:hypothetical protein